MLRPLVGAVKTYAWGLKGLQSKVAELQADNPLAKFTPDPDTSYAELWFGDHPAGSAQVLVDGSLVQLCSLPDRKPLPFILKVMSVRTALSLQAHPDRTLAAQLHEKQPSAYPDPNHKPEMIIALTPFEALCQFKSLPDIVSTLAAVPEIEKAIAGERLGPIRAALAAGDARGALRPLLSALMRTDSAWIKSCVEEAVHRTAQSTDERHVLMRRLHAQYPGDVGVFAALLLNHMRLQPGEALFLGPNEPHAYLSGEGIEAMACSDNVVRAGLTPKPRDDETLVRMLTYTTGEPTVLRGTPAPQQPHVWRYVPPHDFPEFALEITSRDADSSDPVLLPARPGDSVLLVLSGQGTVAVGDRRWPVRRGVALLVPADTELRLTASPAAAAAAAGAADAAAGAAGSESAEPLRVVRCGSRPADW